MMIQKIEDRCQAMIDISLQISNIRNTSFNFSNKFSVDFRFITNNGQINALPYQVIQAKKVPSNATITLQTYHTSEYVVHPKKSINISEICLFRLSMSLQEIFQTSLICQARLINQGEVIAVKQIQLVSIIGMHAYLPIFFTWYSIQIQASVETQLLGIKLKKNSLISRSLFYTILDCLVDQNNRLNKKLQDILEIQKDYSRQCSISDDIIQVSQMTESNLQFPLFPEFQIQKLGKYHPIFHRSLQKDKEKIFCLGNFCYQATHCIQMRWRQYILRQLNYIQSKNSKNRQRYYQDFKYGFTKFHKIIDLEEPPYILAHSIKIGLNFSIQKKQTLIPDKQYDTSISNYGFKSKHLVILVHGFGANASAMVLYETTLTLLFPDLIILRSRANQNSQENKTIDQMSKSLAAQIQMYLHGKSTEDLQISFIAHSLGGLVVRGALTLLQAYKYNFSTFISLSCPHFGHLKHSNYLTKIGMMAINKIWHYSVINSLLFKDSSQTRDCYLYHLGFHPGMSWFQNIYLYGSPDDGYVSSCSALMQASAKINIQNLSKSKKILNQLQIFFQQNLKTTKVEKYQIIFEENFAQKQKIHEKILGRGPHLAFLTRQDFIQCILLNCSKQFESREPENELQ